MALHTKYFVVARRSDTSCVVIEDTAGRIHLFPSMAEVLRATELVSRHYPDRQYYVREIDVPSTWQYCQLSDIVVYSKVRNYLHDPLYLLDVSGVTLDDQQMWVAQSIAKPKPVPGRRRIIIRKPNE